MEITKDRVVQIHYTLTDKDGNRIDSSEGREPLEYIHGNNMLIPGLEAQLEGKSAGEKFSAVVEPKDAYGEYDGHLVLDVPRSQFDTEQPVEVGMAFQAGAPNGGTMIVRVINVSGDSVTIDGNHELAGKPLFFAVEVVSVRDATEEELAAVRSGGCGSCGSCGGDCGGSCDCGESGCGGCGDCGG